MSLFRHTPSSYTLLFDFFLLGLHADRIIATINPNKPIASAKIKMRIMPTNSFGSTAFMRTPISPTTPIAKPAAY